MNWNAAAILAAVGSGLALAGLIRPTWPLTAIGCFLVGIAVLLVAGGVGK